MNSNQIIIFASGSGSNAENIVNYFSNKRSNLKWLICTNNPKARVIERAKKLNIDFKIFTKDELYNDSILNFLYTRASYNGYYPSFPSWRRGFDSLRPLILKRP